MIEVIESIVCSMITQSAQCTSIGKAYVNTFYENPVLAPYPVTCPILISIAGRYPLRKPSLPPS